MGRYFVSGGAGFVGSHLVALLVARGHAVTVFDNLRQGHRAALPPEARLAAADLADAAALEAVLAEGPWDGVFHFAGLIEVGASMRDPLLYFRANAGLSADLVAACLRHGVRRFVFSSSAAVYGAPARVPIGEDSPLAPTSPYGESKAMTERVLAWASAAHGLRYAALRYFNAAGADPEGRRGEDHAPETHLIPLAIDAALARRPPLALFGTDYETPDGTAIRDYIHVSDLAEAHLAALAALEAGDLVANVGTGRGHSVREVIAAVRRVLGRDVPVTESPRRPGDPPVLIADPAQLAARAGWTPRHPDLETLIAHAAAWRVAHPAGYGEQ